VSGGVRSWEEIRRDWWTNGNGTAIILVFLAIPNEWQRGRKRSPPTMDMTTWTMRTNSSNTNTTSSNTSTKHSSPQTNPISSLQSMK